MTASGLADLSSSSYSEQTSNVDSADMTVSLMSSDSVEDTAQQSQK